MKTIHRYILLLAVALSASCSKPVGEEEQGLGMLQEARREYRLGNYAAARDSILALRQRFPMAFEARRQAILLLDSVELMDAGGDSLKAEFYRRKLEHDIGKMKE